MNGIEAAGRLLEIYTELENMDLDAVSSLNGDYEVFIMGLLGHARFFLQTPLNHHSVDDRLMFLQDEIKCLRASIPKA